MEFIKQTDFDTINKYAGEKVTANASNELKNIYEKLDYLCRKIATHGFEFSIRKDPRVVSGKNIYYREYQWAKIFPKNFKKECDNKFGYVVGLSDSLHFHMMGIKDFQNHLETNLASDRCRIEIPLEDKTYESIALDFVNFDNKYRDLFIKTGAILNIKICQETLLKMEMEKTINLIKYKKQIILQGPPGTGKTHTGKDLAEKLIFDKVSDNKEDQKECLESSNQFKLIQFHPSYTYEDFVRGIIAENSEKGLEYKTIDKVLAKLAKDANENYINHHKNPELAYRKEWIRREFDSFRQRLEVELSNQPRIQLTPLIFMYQIEDDCIKYKGDNWDNNSRINFIDFIRLIDANLETRQNINIQREISNHAFYRKPYYSSLLNRFFNESGAYNPSVSSIEELKNYVLIIDEINRANLSSVIGELVYALEYRGETIDTMYDINGDSKITIPKNLYIIGTMNTADRSVGHIDYAIRRRFGFVPVLPDINIITGEKGKQLFQEVAKLFVVENEEGKLVNSDLLSPDFNFEDIQLGHSYFLGDDNELPIKLEHEIKPILGEYIKDGILNPKAQKIVDSLYV